MEAKAFLRKKHHYPEDTVPDSDRRRFPMARKIIAITMLAIMVGSLLLSMLNRANQIAEITALWELFVPFYMVLLPLAGSVVIGGGLRRIYTRKATPNTRGKLLEKVGIGLHTQIAKAHFIFFGANELALYAQYSGLDWPYASLILPNYPLIISGMMMLWLFAALLALLYFIDLSLISSDLGWAVWFATIGLVLGILLNFGRFVFVPELVGTEQGFRLIVGLIGGMVVWATALRCLQIYLKRFYMRKSSFGLELTPDMANNPGIFVEPPHSSPLKVPHPLVHVIGPSRRLLLEAHTVEAWPDETKTVYALYYYPSINSDRVLVGDPIPEDELYPFRAPTPRVRMHPFGDLLARFFVSIRPKMEKAWRMVRMWRKDYKDEFQKKL